VSVESLRAAIADGDRLLLDTSVVAAFLDACDANHPIAVHVVDELVASGRNPAVVSMVGVMELLVRPMRAVPPGHHTVLGFLRTFPNLECVPVDLQVAQEAAHLRAASRFSTPDALIVATGLAAQVHHLVTNDRDWAPKLAPMAGRIGVVVVSDHLPFP
jgi:predicted nucleic acid-binding protein